MISLKLRWQQFFRMTIGLALVLLGANSAYAEDLQISAAISLKDSLEALTPVFQASHPGTRLYLNFGASGSLARQVEAGAPVDVFFSASSTVMNRMESKNLLMAGSRVAMLSNEIVLVVNPAMADKIRDFSDLYQAQRLGIGDPAFVPVGQYAKQTLESLHLWESLKERFILGADARQVVTYAARHEVDAALVFATDARIVAPHLLKVVASAAPGTHAPIHYEVAVVRATAHSALAAEYLHFLQAPQASTEFTKAGFGLIRSSDKH